jgi:hypothetical protein
MKALPRAGFFSRLFPCYRRQPISIGSERWRFGHGRIEVASRYSEILRPSSLCQDHESEEGDVVSILLTIKGAYRDGKVELSQRPEGVEENASVLVTFLPAPELSHPNPADPTTQAADAEAVRHAAAERFLARLKKGIPFGGPPYPKREELYDRLERHDENPR